MNSPTPAALQPLAFPLTGSRLIEASAGTGKTFTIAALYLRLVLGHGGEAAFARPLDPPEILVVTFTDAATKELRDRIRARLAEAAAYFLDDTAGPDAADPLLRELRADYPPEAWPGCARKLQLAAEWMDEAAVSTIHGWCHRMLREHAFDSGSLFTQRLETDEDDLLADVVRDYWRSFMYPLDVAGVRKVTKWWASPDKLKEVVKRLLPHAGLLDAQPAPADSLTEAEAERARRLAALKAPWATWCDELRTLIEGARAAKQFNAKKLNSANSERWIAALERWAADPLATAPALTETAWTRLTPAGMAEIWLAGTPPTHPALAAVEALQAELAALPEGREPILRHAARWVAARFAEEQARRAQMGFNDLLTRLDAALAGPNGARLAELIRVQFPVALIDEFQDTDAVQYRIFDTVYRVAANDPATALILIGDPKQAIYAFRGADIYTYLDARRATAGRLYTLRRNFRSTADMVAAANRCFELAENRSEGQGAFLFRSGDANPVPFLPAEAQGREDALEADGAPLPALTAWCLPGDDKPMSKEAYLDALAEVCASEMVRLLNLGEAGRAGFNCEGRLRALRPADMAVLVNNRNEADKIRAALSARGVRSVYLSERESVFRRPEAADMQRWLVACAEPDDGRAVRAALATATLGLDWFELDRLNHDEIQWDNYIDLFRGYRDCWRRQGVLPMLRRLLTDFRVPARLLAAGGERSLTDLLHLAELLQQASSLLDGEHALIRHLAEQRADDSTGGEARQIRLESDANLVQVVTVHKSKGLEYPLVFLPFACAFRAARPDDLPLKWHDDAGRLQLALADDGGRLDRVDRERLGEDLRKLYVALTRARHACWIGAAPIKDFERSALGYLLGGNVAGGLDALAAGHPEIAVIHAPPVDHERYTGHALAVVEGEACRPARSVRENWWIASYSSLQTGAGVDTTVATGADTAAEDIFREVAGASRTEAAIAVPAAPTAPAPAAGPSRGPLHGFPRGAAVGTFLHEILEWAAGQGFASVAEAPEVLRDAVARRCAVRGWTEWIDPLTGWLQDFLRLPLGEGDDFSLAGLHGAVAEMEFWIAAHEVDLGQVDALVRRHTLGAADRPPLTPGRLNGMLKGFIDLVAEHDGRYYVIDYKSNWLGPDDAAYTPAAMAASILAERYELQYVLYLLALHRLLKLRLPGYDYDRHIGGALYLFLRGSDAPSRGIHADRPPRALIEGLDQLFSRRTATEAA